MKFRPHRLRVLFQDDLAGKCIGVDSPLSNGMNTMVPVNYSSIQPGFQAIAQARYQRLYEHLGGKFFQRGEFGGDERFLGVEEFQGCPMRVA
jgi:hypothetical protein